MVNGGTQSRAVAREYGNRFGSRVNKDNVVGIYEPTAVHFNSVCDALGTPRQGVRSSQGHSGYFGEQCLLILVVVVVVIACLLTWLRSARKANALHRIVLKCFVNCLLRMC